MKKLRLILLSAVLVAVFGFSFIGCSNDSSNSASSNHDMTIQLKDASNNTYTYYADYDANDDHARMAHYFEMKVFKSNGTEITDDSVSILHLDNREYSLNFADGTDRCVEFRTEQPYTFTSYVNDESENTKIVELTINGQTYTED